MVVGVANCYNTKTQLSTAQKKMCNLGEASPLFSSARAKINIFVILFEWNGPQRGLQSEKKSNMLILSFEVIVQL